MASSDLDPRNLTGGDSDGSGSSGGDGGGSGGVVPPILKNPRKRVLGIVLGFFVSGLVAAQTVAIETVQTVRSQISGAFVSAGLATNDSLVAAFGSVLSLVSVVRRSLAGVASDSGLAGPILVAGLASAVVIGIAGVVSAVLTLVGWRP